LRSCPRKGKLERLHWTKRDIIDSIFYQLKNGCNWEDLPKDLPPYSTVYWHVHSVARSWSDRTIDASLTRASARTAQKKAKWTTLLIIDSFIGAKYLQWECGFKGVLFLESDEWH